ncbi:hypothetical protein FACS1894137_10300 [Spirochaetia bacterium]|nr:hypothetical protein FACS1894137_10300 [Spirochaetia bacterium]
MKRKDFLVLFPVIIGAMVFAACASAPKSLPPVDQTAATSGDIVTETYEYVRVDWQARNVGAEIPGWVQYAATGDPNNELANLPRLSGKKPIVAQEEGQNLQIVQSALNTNAYAECAQKIRTAVSITAAAGLEGSLNRAAATSVVNQFNTLYSKATIMGLTKEMDSWVKERSTKDGTEKYTAYALYSISEADLRASIDETLGKVAAQTQEEQGVKNRLQDQLDDLVRGVKF